MERLWIIQQFLHSPSYLLCHLLVKLNHIIPRALFLHFQLYFVVKGGYKAHAIHMPIWKPCFSLTVLFFYFFIWIPNFSSQTNQCYFKVTKIAAKDSTQEYFVLCCWGMRHSIASSIVFVSIVSIQKNKDMMMEKTSTLRKSIFLTLRSAFSSQRLIWEVIIFWFLFRNILITSLFSFYHQQQIQQHQRDK